MASFNTVEYAAQIAQNGVPFVEADQYMGRLRLAFFSFTSTGTINIADTFNLCFLPAGRVRLLSAISYVNIINPFTATAVMDIGHPAYTQEDGTAVAADPNAFSEDLIMSTQGRKTFIFTTSVPAKVDPLLASADRLVVTGVLKTAAGSTDDQFTGAVVFVND